MELWDAYNEKCEKIHGMTLVRGEPIPEGVFHLVSDVIVRHTDGEYLLMLRDERKHFGGMWEATAGGSAVQGEDALSCARRELREETGIEADALTEAGRVVDRQGRTIYVEFLCVTAREKTSVRIQEGETVAYRWVSREELLQMRKEELVTRRMQRFIDELASPDISYIARGSKFNYRVCGIFLREGKLLVMHDERSPYYYLPGGRVKLGETAEQALLREIEEELHFTPHILRPLWLNQGFFTEDVDALRYHELCLYFLLSASDADFPAGGESFTLREGAHTHVFQWLPLDRLQEESFYPVFLKTEIFRLPESFTLRAETE